MIKIVNIIKPSSLSILLSSLANIYKMNPATVMINISGKWKLKVFTPPKIIMGRVRTKPILKIFVPIILPIMISNSPFLTEVIAITNSGVLVPITRITIVITF